jgi:hypothetical protein
MECLPRTGGRERWLPPNCSYLLLIAIRFTFCRAEGDFGSVTVRTPLSNFAATLSWSTERSYEVSRLNGMIIDYNSRCASFRYRAGIFRGSDWKLKRVEVCFGGWCCTVSIARGATAAYHRCTARCANPRNRRSRQADSLRTLSAAWVIRGVSVRPVIAAPRQQPNALAFTMDDEAVAIVLYS